MKTIFFLAIFFLPAIGFSQVVDTAAVAREVDRLISLSRNYTGKELLEQALQLAHEALKTTEEGLGKRNVKYASCLHNLGRVYYFKKEYKSAEAFYLESKKLRAELSGREDPDYAASLNNLGVLYVDLGLYDKADSFLLQAKRIRENKFGKEHSEYLGSLTNLVRLYSTIGRYGSAEPLYLEIKSIQEKLLGKTSSDFINTLYRLADLYETTQRYKDAESLYLEAKEILQTVLDKRRLDYGISLYHLASLYHSIGHDSTAEPFFLEARTIFKNELGKEHRRYAYLLNNLGLFYKKIGRYESAEIIFIEAKEIFERTLGKEDPNYVLIVDNLGLLYIDIGHYKIAEDLLIEAKTIREKTLGKDKPAYAKSLYNLAILYENIGRYKLAEEFFIEAKLTREKTLGKENTDYAESLNGLAVLYSDMGRYEEAERLYMEVLSIREKTLGKEHADYVKASNNLGLLYRRTGRYEDAEKIHLATKSFWEKKFGREHENYAKSLTNLAGLYNDMGNHNKAEALLLEAKYIWERKFGKKYAIENISFSLGVVYFKMRRYDLAEVYYLEYKLSLENKEGKENASYAAILNNLAILYWEMDRREEAISNCLEAKAIREKVSLKEHPEYPIGLHDLALMYDKMKIYHMAEPLYLEAKSIWEKLLGKEHPVYAQGLNNMAVFYWRQGYYETAALLFFEAIVIQNKRLAKSYRHLSERELSLYVDQYKQVANAYFSLLQTHAEPRSKFTAACFDNALFHKGFLLTAANRLKRLALSDTTSAKLYERWLSHHRRLAIEYAKPIADRDSANIAAQEVKATTLEKELTRTVAGFGEALRQVTWQEVQEKLHLGEAAIEFIYYRYYNPEASDSTIYSALVLRPDGKAPIFVPLFEEREIKQWLEGASGKSVGGINALYSVSAENIMQKSLYDLIWKPLEPMLKDARTVYYSPSGLLHRINLGAIPVAEGQIFTERHPLVLLGSTRQLATNAESEKISGAKTATFFGGIRYDSMAVAGVKKADTSEAIFAAPRGAIFFRGETHDTTWKYLNFSEQEVKNIQPYLRNAGYQSNLFSGYEATEESFKNLGQKSPSPSILHATTHGFFYPDPKDTVSSRQWQLTEDRQPVFKLSDNPMMRAGLIFAGANRVWQGKDPLPGRDDGILTAYEISQMNLSNTELVVLSACETGLGDIEGNEGVYGLQRAFKIAGAKYLIMSLWQVNDLTTSELMIDFYRQWLEKNLSIPDAFRAAQAGMKAKYPDYPYHWAGFVLIE